MKKIPGVDDLSRREMLLFLLTGTGIAALTAYLFYRSFIAFILLMFAMPAYLKYRKSRALKKKKKELALQFKDAILAVSSALSAGYSVENAFIQSIGDLKNLYSAKAPIVVEFSNIAGRLGTNEPLEDILFDLALRSGSPDIKDFADVFVIAKRNGGDMVSIIRRTAYHISDKTEVARDIDTLISAKKMEQRIMNVIPFLIIFYVSVSSPGFLDALYNNLLGVLVMSACLAAYGFAIYLSEKIISIEV